MAFVVAFLAAYWPVHVKGSVCPAMTSSRSCVSGSGYIILSSSLTGTYADGLGAVKKVPDRIDFDPFPWHSMAVWILTQMKRWGYVEGSIDYKKIAEQVYLASDAKKMLTELGYGAPDKTYENYTIMGKEFDYNKPEEYIASFDIKR